VIHEVNKLLFIVNKHAGTGYQSGVDGKILDACEQHDVECTIEFTRRRGHATELANHAIENKFDAVVAVGGDGTLNEVARALTGSPVPMGIIPRGSGNGLARHLGIPIRIGPALGNIFKGRIIQMDTFTVNGKLSLNISGIGFDGHIANLFGKDGKRGLPGYTKLTVKEYSSFKEFDAVVQADGKDSARKAFMIAIANSSQYGNNARIAPTASVCDSMLHLNFVRKVPLHRFDFVLSLFAGKIDHSRYCEILEAQILKIKTESAVPYHIDGEPCGKASEFEIVIHPGSLRMIVPKETGRRI
jgi:YegS/Rv2252/BmrU family lipid kinase